MEASRSKASISLDQPLPVRFGDQVTFTVEGADPTTGSIQLQAYVDGALVFSAAHMTYPGGYGYGQPFTLGPSASWTGGAAEAVAILGHRRRNGHYRVDAQTTFPVDA